MREYEHRRVERCVVAPPSLPVEVLPRSALRTKLIAPHDLGTDVPGEVASAEVVKSVRSTRIDTIDPMRGRSRPREEISRIRPTEWMLETLPTARAVAIARHREVVDTDNLGHWVPS